MRRKSGEQLRLSDVLTAHRDTWIQYKEAHNERVNAHYHTDALILYSQKHGVAEMETNTQPHNLSFLPTPL